MFCPKRDLIIVTSTYLWLQPISSYPHTFLHFPSFHLLFETSFCLFTVLHSSFLPLYQSINTFFHTMIHPVFISTLYHFYNSKHFSYVTDIFILQRFCHYIPSIHLHTNMSKAFTVYGPSSVFTFLFHKSPHFTSNILLFLKSKFTFFPLPLSSLILL